MERELEVRTDERARPRFLTPVIAFWGGLCFVPFFYWSTLSGGYLSDDFWWMSDLRTKGPFSVWTSNSPFFRPVASYEMWLFDRVAGGHPWLLRAVNLMLMILSAILVRGIALCLAKKSKNDQAWIGAVSGLVFAYFSSHSEPVCWISCICDTNCLFWGLGGVYTAFLLVNQQVPFSRAGLALVALLCFILSMASKETGVIFPLVATLLLPFVIEASMRVKKSAMAWMSAACLLFLGGYLWLHYLFGIGWGHREQFTVPRPIIESNISIDLPNTLLPFGKWLSAYNNHWLDGPLNLLGLAFALLILWRSGPAKESRLNALKKLRDFCSKFKNELILAWITGIYALDLLNLPDSLTPIFNVNLGLIVLALVALIRYRLYRNVWVRTALFGVGLWYLWSNEVSILYHDFRLYGTWDVAPGKFSILMLLAYVYLHRPSTWNFDEVEKTWTRTAFVSLVCAGLLLAPAITVPFTFLDGRGQRFAYEASAFSAIAWSFGLVVVFSKHRNFLRIATAGFLAMLAAGLALNNREWAYAGRISSTMASHLSNLVQYKPRRIYMLSEVAFVSGAEALNNGDQNLVDIYCPGSSTEIRSACKQWGFLPGDHLTFKENPPFVFTPTVREKDTTHFDSDHLVASRPGENRTSPGTFFNLTTSMTVTVEGYERGDIIAYLDGDDFKIIRWDR